MDLDLLLGATLSDQTSISLCQLFFPIDALKLHDLCVTDRKIVDTIMMGCSTNEGSGKRKVR